MSVIATALKHLIAAGVSGDDLVRAVADMEAELAANPPVKVRSAGALRTERYRARRAAAAAEEASQSVTCDERDACDVTSGSLSPFPNENKSNPNPHTLPDMNTRARGPWDFHVSAWKLWREAHPFPRPWWADRQVWSDWMEVRKSKKARNTITAHNGFLADVAKHSDAEWPPGRLLQHAAARSWLSINRPEEPRHANFNRPTNQNSRPSNGHSPDKRSSLTRACDEALDWLGGASA